MLGQGFYQKSKFYFSWASIPIFLLGLKACRLRFTLLCVYMQKQRQETYKQAMEGKDAKSIRKRHKADKYGRHGKQRNKKSSKQARRQTSKKENKGPTKGGVHRGQM